MNILDSAVMRELHTYTLSVDKTLTCSTLARPKEFFAVNDSPAILEPFCEVAAKGFEVPQEEKGLEEIRGVVGEADFLVVLHKDTVLSGFASAIYWPEQKVAYLHGIVIDPDVQGQHVADLLTVALLEQTECRRLAFTTQNPRMFCLGRKVTESILPNPDRPSVPESEWETGKMLMRGKESSLDLTTFIRRDIYEKCLYEKIPPSRDRTVNEWFAKSLEIRNGQTRHGFLFIGSVR